MTHESSGSGSAGSRKKSSGPGLRFTPQPLTREEVLTSGERAASLLSSPVYNLVVNSVVANLQDALANTLPHERERREWLYNQIQALGAVNFKLAEMAQMAQAVNADILRAEEIAQRHPDAGLAI